MSNLLPDFKTIFHKLNGNFLILKPDFPRFTILDYRIHSVWSFASTKDDFKGNGLFDVLSLAREDFSRLISDMKESLEFVVRAMKEDEILITRIFVNDENGKIKSEELYNIINKPVYNELQELQYIIVQMINITKIVENTNRTQDDARLEKELIRQDTLLDELNFRNTLLEVRTEATPDGVLVVDAKGKIISMNHKFVEIWRFPQYVVDQKDDNLALQHAMTRLVDPQAFIERVRYLYDHPNERDHEVMHFKDGRMIERYGLPVIGSNGKYYGWVWYLRDITDQINQLLAVEKVRQKVARDLHDDVGATLTSIGLLSELALTRLDINVTEARQLIKKIRDNSSTMMESMSDIVWSINPNNDSMQMIISRMREYAITLFEGRNIEFRFTVNPAVEGLELDIDIRLDFFLIFKESVNNIIKYANANFVEISINLENQQLHLSIKDNGVGFDMKNYKPGNGLENIRKRASDIKGTIIIESAPGKGTSIYLVFPVA